MIAKNRSRLLCIKELRSGVFDIFTVVVLAGKEDAAKKEYARWGYKVR